MKNYFTLLCLMIFGLAFAQEIQGPFNVEYRPERDHSPCLTASQRQAIVARLENSRRELRKHGLLPGIETDRGVISHPLFQWPVVKNPDAPYTDVWGISNYVDHDPNYPNQTQDWNCGTKTYDTAGGYNHQGIDIFLWPFSWYQFQNNQAWAVAAAPGIIIAKDDGNFDMNCSLNGTDWNAVYVQHSDGSFSWYGHLKNGTLTEKGAGEMVAAGEYLGVVGSSGNSTGPHLHFEVYDNLGQLVDPWSGACNNWASATETWWATQKAYFEPKINAVFTHSGVPAFNTCPQTETTKFKDSFLSTEVVYGAVYLTDQTIGSTGTFMLKRPDGTTAFTGNVVATTQYNASYWWWSFAPSTFNQYGTWTVEFTYFGQTVVHPFVYGSNLGIQESGISRLEFYPNPAQSQITFTKDIEKLELFQADGKKIAITLNGRTADVSTLPNGVFILRGIDSGGAAFTRKLVK